MPVGVVRRCDSEEKSANFASIFLVFCCISSVVFVFLSQNLRRYGVIIVAT